MWLISYTYVNQTGRVSQMTYPNGQVTNYSYYPNSSATPGNDDQRLQSIANLVPLNSQLSTLSSFTYTYDPEGIIQTWARQNDTASALTSSFTYDSADQLTSASSPSLSSVQKFRYLYDKAGNRTAEQIDSGVAAATVNNLNQITALSSTGPIHFAGGLSEPANVTVNGVPAALDANNNFSADVPLAPGSNDVPVVATDGNGNTTTKSYQVTVTDSGVNRTLTYDANGNLTNDGNGKTYGYDAANRLVSVTQSGNVTGFVYDGFSHRVQETSNGTVIKQWVWCPGDMQACEERDGSNNVTKRFYAQGEQINGVPFFLTYDHLGSVREMTDSTGAIRARYDYDPWGRTTKLQGDLDADFRFQDMYYDTATSLYDTWFRWYGPDLARWLSREPLGELGPDGPNLYWFCLNNPICAIDPFGLADVNMVDPGDPSHAGGDVIPKGGSTFTVVSHGAVGGNGFYSDPNTQLSRDQIKQAIDNGGHKPGQTIQVYSCYGGVGNNLDDLKQIAKDENSPIIAATSAVAPEVSKKTGAFVGSSVGDSSGPGSWVQISPKGSVTPYTPPAPTHH